MGSWPQYSLGRVLLVAVHVILTSQLVSAQSGDGGAATGNLQGSAFNNNEQAAAQGPSTSSANLSVGATVAIAVVVGLVVVFGALTAYLFFMAKKRQWTIRETLRHSRKRVATGLKTLASPRTPHRATFTPVKTKFSQKETSSVRGTSPRGARGFSRLNREESEDTNALRGRDLEKGQAINTTTAASSQSRNGSQDVGQKGKKLDMKISIPQKNSPTGQSPQTPMWTKFLGRT